MQDFSSINKRLNITLGHFRRTDDECLQFFFTGEGGPDQSYDLYAIDENGHTQHMYEEYLQLEGATSWNLASMKLHRGVKLVTLSFTSIYNYGWIAVDDLWVAPCEDFSEYQN